MNRPRIVADGGIQVERDLVVVEGKVRRIGWGQIAKIVSAQDDAAGDHAPAHGGNGDLYGVPGGAEGIAIPGQHASLKIAGAERQAGQGFLPVRVTKINGKGESDRGFRVFRAFGSGHAGERCRLVSNSDLERCLTVITIAIHNGVNHLQSEVLSRTVIKMRIGRELPFAIAPDGQYACIRGNGSCAGWADWMDQILVADGGETGIIGIGIQSVVVKQVAFEGLAFCPNGLVISPVIVAVGHRYGIHHGIEKIRGCGVQAVVTVTHQYRYGQGNRLVLAERRHRVIKIVQLIKLYGGRGRLWITHGKPENRQMVIVPGQSRCCRRQGAETRLWSRRRYRHEC